MGCIGYATNCFSVMPLPTLTIAGPSTLCAGYGASLIASGASNYAWSTGAIGPNIGISPTVSTCYTVVGSNGNCSGSAVKCVTVIPSSITITGNNNICIGASATLTANGSSNYTWMPGNMSGTSIVVSPTATTCYTVTGVNANNCQAFAGYCLIVQPNPNVITTSGFFCSGGQATLSASGAVTYTWYPFNLNGSSIVVTPTAGACFSVVGTSTYGCIGSASSCFSVAPSPTISISGNSTLCAGQTQTLTASGAISYTWSTGATGPNALVSPTTTTCYSVVGTNSYCSSSAVKCITVQIAPNVTISGSNTVCQYNWIALTGAGATNYTWLPGNLTTQSITPTVNANTCYTLIGSNGSSCLGMAVKCVTARPNPTLTLNGNANLCAGNTSTFSVTGALTYTWSGLNQTGSVAVVNPTANFCFSVSGTNTFGCMGTTGTCVTVQPSPTVSISGNSTLCSGSFVLLTGSGASTYTWIPGNAQSSSITASPSVSTCYTLTGTGPNGCKASAVKCLTVKPSPILTISGNMTVCSGFNTTLTVSGASTYSWLQSNTTGSVLVVTPTASPCYSIAGTGTNGCTGYTGTCINYVIPPTITISGSSTLCSGKVTTLTALGAPNNTWMPGNIVGSTIVVTPTANSCYTVTGSNAPGCTGTAVKCFSIMPAPTLTISGSNAICVGSSATLLASGAVTYSWNTGSTNPLINVSPTVTTCYTVTGTNASGCKGLASTCLSVQPKPIIYAFGDTTICQGDGTVLTATGATSYTWSTGANSYSILVSPMGTTTYTLVGMTTPGCTSSTKITVHVQICLGVDENNKVTAYIVYPNPTTGEFTLQGYPGKVNYSVYDLTGREILKGTLTASQTIDISSYQNGAYFIRIEAGGSVTHKKLILEK
jgi:hypothetical protein